MQAVICAKYGPPEILQLADIAKPSPKDHEVLIKVHATTVNRTDCGFRNARPFIVRFFSGLFWPKRKILGSELSGEIEATGKEVRSFKIGDQIFGLSCDTFGAHAEYICLPEEGSITIKPSGITFEEAAAVCEGPWLALTCIKKLNIQRGQRILIYGASGSIGSSAVQLCRYFGAEITAVCSTPNLELVKSLGANEVIDYLKEDFTKSDKTFDFVFDAVGKSSFFQCKRLLKPKGIYISTDLGSFSQNPFLALWTSGIGSKKVLFPIPRDSKEDIEFFKALLEAGKLRAVIDRHYPMEKIVEAYRYVETGQKTGSVVITVA